MTLPLDDTRLVVTKNPRLKEDSEPFRFLGESNALDRVLGICDLRFESSVISSGSKTFLCVHPRGTLFESSVISSGSKTGTLSIGTVTAV